MQPTLTYLPMTYSAAVSSLIQGSIVEQLYSFLIQVSTYILNVIDTYGYYGILVGMTIESMGIPLPSEIILPYGGYLAYLGHLNFFAVTLTGTLACVVGSLFTYFIAFYGGNYLFERYGKYVGITKRELNVANAWFDRYGEISVFISRMIPGVRAYSSIPAGICRMDVKKFSVYTFLGSLPWNLALVFAGYYLGANWQSISAAYYYFVIIVLVVLLCVGIGFVLLKRAKTREPT
ncbi:MAG: DedA family protein [Halobacteriota archaeon]